MAKNNAGALCSAVSFSLAGSLVCNYNRTATTGSSEPQIRQNRTRNYGTQAFFYYFIRCFDLSDSHAFIGQDLPSKKTGWGTGMESTIRTTGISADADSRIFLFRPSGNRRPYQAHAGEVYRIPSYRKGMKLLLGIISLNLLGNLKKTFFVIRKMRD